LTTGDSEGLGLAPEVADDAEEHRPQLVRNCEWVVNNLNH
jgi:hypothetical protein